MAAKITLQKNGPYIVEGNFRLVDADGNEYGLGGREKVLLCRCGNSFKKPFCDGTHKTCGFAHEPKAYRLPAPVQPVV